LVKRGTDPDSLDQTLYQAAVRAGVRFNFSQALNIEEAKIVATGPRSREVFAIDTGVHFQTSHENIAVAIVNDQAAYRGYAYLLIINGYGCICTVMFDRFKQIHQHYEHTLSILKKHLSFDMVNPKRVGGVGSFSNDLCFAQHGKYFVGEAAGLQDLLWGFGIRSAISSGALAARCLIDGTDYGKLAEELFSDQLKAGIVIRYLFEKFSRLPKGYILMGKLVRGQTNPAEFLRKAYGYTPIHKLILPLAKMNMQKRYPALYF
jgi:flavin-dependent dehydrogenase